MPLPALPNEDKFGGQGSPTKTKGQELGVAKVGTVEVIDGVETSDIVDLEYGSRAEKSRVIDGNVYDVHITDGIGVDKVMKTVDKR